MAKPTRRRTRDPFEVELNEKDRKDLAVFLSEEVQNALDARDTIIGDGQQLDKFHELYEGGDGKITKNYPWPGAANLTSWIGTEKVDAVRSRVVKTLFVEPIWTVEGWAESASRVPFVEQFHQWKAEEERLQTYVSKTVHNALIEGTGVLEVSERPVARKVRTRVNAMIRTGKDGLPIADPKTGKPLVMLDGENNPVPAPPDTPPELIAQIIMDRVGKVRNGPQYRVISLKDYVHFPGHAVDKSDIWGYAKRFYERVSKLKTMEKLGIYSFIDKIGDEDERQQRAEHDRNQQNIAPQKGFTAEKELWEVLFLHDLDEDGIEEWYVATLHIGKRELIRLQRDDLGQARYVLFVPYPRSTSVYGYSLMQKLDSIIAEHTAWRNMIADRTNLVINAPLLRVFGSTWNPVTQPFGPGRVMDVRSGDDVKPLLIPDVPSSAVHREATVLAASERVSGLVDEATGSHPQEERTLGEVKIVTSSSLVRIEEIVHGLQEGMEDLFNLRHEMWKRTLRENPEPFPSGLQAALEARGLKLPEGEVDASMLEGTFRGKPHGSVETADTTQQRADFIGFLTAMGQYAQAVPAVAATLSDPEVTRAILQQGMRVFRWETRGVIEAALAKQQNDPNVAQMAKMLQMKAAGGGSSNGSEQTGAGGPRRPR